MVGGWVAMEPSGQVMAGMQEGGRRWRRVVMVAEGYSRFLSQCYVADKAMGRVAALDMRLRCVCAAAAVLRAVERSAGAAVTT